MNGIINNSPDYDPTINISSQLPNAFEQISDKDRVYIASDSGSTKRYFIPKDILHSNLPPSLRTALSHQFPNKYYYNPYIIFRSGVNGEVADHIVAMGFDSLRKIPVILNITKQIASPFLNARQTAEMIREINHPHIIRIHETGTLNYEDTDFDVSIMPAGICTLENTNLSVPQRLMVMHQMAFALQACHKNRILYRDFKPSNVILMQYDISNPNSFRNANLRSCPLGMLIDFNVAIPFDRFELAIAGAYPYYSPQEIGCSGYRMNFDTQMPLIDVYKFALCCYEMFCYRVGSKYSALEYLFKFENDDHVQDIESLIHWLDNDSLHLTNPILPVSEFYIPPFYRDGKTNRLHPAIFEVIQKGAHKDPLQRYPTALALMEDLMEIITPQQVITHCRHNIYLDDIIPHVKSNRTNSFN